MTLPLEESQLSPRLLLRALTRLREVTTAMQVPSLRPPLLAPLPHPRTLAGSLRSTRRLLQRNRAATMDGCP